MLSPCNTPSHLILYYLPGIQQPTNYPQLPPPKVFIPENSADPSFSLPFPPHKYLSHLPIPQLPLSSSHSKTFLFLSTKHLVPLRSSIANSQELVATPTIKGYLSPTTRGYPSSTTSVSKHLQPLLSSRELRFPRIHPREATSSFHIPVKHPRRHHMVCCSAATSLTVYFYSGSSTPFFKVRTPPFQLPLLISPLSSSFPVRLATSKVALFTGILTFFAFLLFPSTCDLMARFFSPTLSHSLLCFIATHARAS